MINYPKFLKAGDTIGITAPSDGANLEKIDLSISKLKEYGFNITETSNVRTRIDDELVSSKANIRAEQFISLWQDKSVNAIISASGGDFLMEIFPYLEKYDDVLSNKENIKWFQGFSDNSSLLHYLTTKYNIATINGGNIGSFAMNDWHDSIIDNYNILTLDKNEYTQYSFEKYQISDYTRVPGDSYNLTEKVEYKSLANKEYEKFEGVIIGGCIDVLSQLLGTKYDNTVNFCKQFESIIWHLDDCELSVASLYRTLWQMKQAGWFFNTKGIILGRTMAPKEYEKLTFDHVLNKVFSDLNIPVIYDVDIGHVMPQWTIINGSYTTFELDNGKGKITQKLKLL